MSNDNSKRLAEIKGKQAWAANGVPSAQESLIREDVPFLLEQLEQAQHQLQGAHDSLREHMLMVKEVQGQRDQACSVVGEFQAEAAGLRAKLAASESAAGAMRAALEHEIMCRACGEEGCESCARSGGECSSAAALATDAGKGWLSPEEAERLQQTHRITQATLSATLEEAERLRKELADMQKAMASRVALYKQVKGSLPGYVSEEECARRCRKTAKVFEAELHGDKDLTPKQEARAEKVLTAIIDRVAKGGE